MGLIRKQNFALIFEIHTKLDARFQTGGKPNKSGEVGAEEQELPDPSRNSTCGQGSVGSSAVAATSLSGRQPRSWAGRKPGRFLTEKTSRWKISAPL